jgi:hypothetical protein
MRHETISFASSDASIMIQNYDDDDDDEVMNVRRDVVI